MPEEDLIILCKDNPEYPDRNFAFGKSLSNSDKDGIIYCIEDCKKYCILKESTRKWR